MISYYGQIAHHNSFTQIRSRARILFLNDSHHHEGTHLSHSSSDYLQRHRDTATPSSGCGKPPTALKNGTNSLTINDATRSFIIHLPANYDNKKPYRTIFAFHATGGSAKDTAKSYYGLLQRAGNSSILVSPQGQDPLESSGKASGIIGSIASGIVGNVSTGWWRTGGKYGEQDLDFVDKIIETIDGDLCTESTQDSAPGSVLGV